MKRFETLLKMALILFVVNVVVSAPRAHGLDCTVPPVLSRPYKPGNINFCNALNVISCSVKPYTYWEHRVVQCAIADINGPIVSAPSDVGFFSPNLMLDAFELGLVARVLNDEEFDENAMTHDMAWEAFEKNYQVLHDAIVRELGSNYALINLLMPQLIPACAYVGAGYGILGDETTLWVIRYCFENYLGYSFNTNVLISYPNWFAWYGDADGDDCDNRKEYDLYLEEGLEAYVEYAWDPAFSEECPGDEGEGEGEDEGEVEGEGEPDHEGEGEPGHEGEGEPELEGEGTDEGEGEYVDEGEGGGEGEDGPHDLRITLIGMSPLALDCAEEYIEFGCETTGGVGEVRIETAGTVNTYAPRRYILVYSARDEAGNEAETTRIVDVMDISPPIMHLNGSDRIDLSCGGVYEELGAVAMDACDGEVAVTISEVESELGYTHILYTARDRAGNIGEAVRIIKHEDTEPPVIHLVGEAEMFLECGAPFSDPSAAAVDNCDGEVTVIFQGDFYSNKPGVYTRNYFAEDRAGNRAEAQRIFRVEDTLPPAITVFGETEMTIECGSQFSDPGAEALDLCEGPVRISTSGAVKTFTPGVYTISYTARDSKRQTTEATRTVTVVCTTPPTITLLGDREMIVPCGKPFVDPGATAMDYRNRSVEVIVHGEVNTNEEGVYTITYTAADEWGNTATDHRNVTVLCESPSQCCGCAALTRCQDATNVKEDIRHFLGDWLLVGLALLALTALRGIGNNQ